MKQLVAAAALNAVVAASPVDTQGIEIFPNGSRPSGRASAEIFTGAVTLDPLFAAGQQTRIGAGHVTFEPGARSAWHTHPAGQLLIVTSGVGWVQEWSKEKREIKSGDVVWIPPGVKHWHGATAANRMRHIAVQETVDGRNVDWLEKVSDEQYAAR